MKSKLNFFIYSLFLLLPNLTFAVSGNGNNGEKDITSALLFMLRGMNGVDNVMVVGIAVVGLFIFCWGLLQFYNKDKNQQITYKGAATRTLVGAIMLSGVGVFLASITMTVHGTEGQTVSQFLGEQQTSGDVYVADADNVKKCIDSQGSVVSGASSYCARY